MSVNICQGSQSPISVDRVEISKAVCRMPSGYRDLDTLMGGGIVKGSMVLIGGVPGIGKSTLAMQIASAFFCNGLKVLYICGEESVEQTALRVNRLGIAHQLLYLFSEREFLRIKEVAADMSPDLVVIDSIQVINKSDIPGSAGSVNQVREVSRECLNIFKAKAITTLIIGHVTKDGSLAGPKILEHLVDVVLDFGESYDNKENRFVRAIKNRFGPTDDIAIFKMGKSGLKEQTNPSQMFLEDRVCGTSGSVIVPTVEGGRALLVELQVLISRTYFPVPVRRANGFDIKRLSLLIAVLEKRVGCKLNCLDVFASLVGGLKLNDPSADLGAVIAILSCYRDSPIRSDTVVFGEVGLGGEVRGVSKAELRVKEAINMGMKRCVLPVSNRTKTVSLFGDKIALQGVSNIKEAIALMF